MLYTTKFLTEEEDQRPCLSPDLAYHFQLPHWNTLYTYAVLKSRHASFIFMWHHSLHTLINKKSKEKGKKKKTASKSRPLPSPSPVLLSIGTNLWIPSLVRLRLRKKKIGKEKSSQGRGREGVGVGTEPSNPTRQKHIVFCLTSPLILTHLS